MLGGIKMEGKKPHVNLISFAPCSLFTELELI